MTAADPNLGEDGLTEAGRQALADKQRALGIVPAAAAAIAAADQAAAAARDNGTSRTAKATAARRAQAAARRAAQLADQAATATQTAADHVAPPEAPQQAPAEAQAPAQARPAEGPCEPCLQHWQAVGDRLDRLETQVQAIGKLVVVGVIGGAVIYFLGAMRPKAAIAARAEVEDQAPAANAADYAAGIESAPVGG